MNESHIAADEMRRDAMVAACGELTRRALSHGSSGNLSLRRNVGQFLISPTGTAFDALQADEIASMDFDGRWTGRRRPSSEWRIHRDILKNRTEVGAIVHTHSRCATALACTGRGIPAFHYMVAVAGGADIRCAPYHPFGTALLSEVTLAALEGRMACLLANHGVIACGKDLSAAVALAGEVENLATQYCAALAIGGVRILSDQEMQRVIDRFRTYGRQDATDLDLIFADGGLPPPGLGR